MDVSPLLKYFNAQWRLAADARSASKQRVDFYWITGVSRILEFHGFVVYPRETFLWSEIKNKWLKGPDLPHSLGVEKGCLTLLNITSVMIIGLTHLTLWEGMSNWHRLLVKALIFKMYLQRWQSAEL